MGHLQTEALIPFAQRSFPQADVGDVLTGATIGVLDYDSFGGYTLQATTLGADADGGLARDGCNIRGVDYDVVHINAEFADQASDHDPQVARIRLSSGCGGGCGR